MGSDPALGSREQSHPLSRKPSADMSPAAAWRGFGGGGEASGDVGEREAALTG